jgi:hypothetical protein
VFALYHNTRTARTDPWSNLLWPRSLEDAGWTWDQLTDQGFLLVLVCAPPLVRRESPLKKKFMSKGEWRKTNAKAGATSIRILVNHWRWLEANGYKRQAASCKRQAASLTRENYNVIQEYKGE